MTVEKQKSPKNRMSQSVLAQIANLPSMNIKELNALWYKLYGKAPTVQRRPYLEGRLAYRIQELEYAQVNPSLLASNEARIEKLTASLKPLAKIQKKKEPFKLVPGTRLKRDFQGKSYEVNVQSDGTFEYEGRPTPASPLSRKKSLAKNGLDLPFLGSAARVKLSSEVDVDGSC